MTQRGNRRCQVFYSRADYLIYLHWLQEYSVQLDVQVLAYCLMTNHVHLILVPQAKDGMSRLFASLHTRFAQRVNRMRNWNGHLWQGRYFASVLDEPKLWSAIRYVERNPVRAGMVQRAEDYPWSSAVAHCSGGRDAILTTDERWLRKVAAMSDWSAWLAEADDAADLEILRLHVAANLPCGSAEFVQTLEAESGRALIRRKRGRPFQQ